MTTSNSTNYSESFIEIVTDALMMIQVLGASEQPSADDFNLASRVLNRMVKEWESAGIYLWAKNIGILFLQKAQKEYLIYSSGDHAADEDDVAITNLSADLLSGVTTIPVDDSSDFLANDNIGIQLDDNSIFWTTVSSVPTTTSIIIASGITGATSDGLFVYGYTTKLDRPTMVLSANRTMINSNIDIPMFYLSYQDYFELPNKDQLGTPVNYNYDKQRDWGIFRIWLVPQDTSNRVKFTYQRKLQDFDNNTDTPDFPQEWLQCLIENLAVKLSVYYGRNTGDLYTNLLFHATQTLQDMRGFDNEQGSLFFKPNNEGKY